MKPTVDIISPILLVGGVIMREKSKLIMEKLLVGGVGLFVGQVPIYAIHPLAVAFFVAAYLNQLESGVLFVAILVSVYSKLSLFGLLKYGIILTLAWIFGKLFQKEKLGIAMCIYIGLLVFLVNVILSAWLGVGESVLILPESCLKALIAGVTAYLLKDGVQ